MEFSGFVLTILIGLLIGLFGGGGSILTVPVLVYLFAVPATLSTTYSLALVSITSLTAAMPHLLRNRLSLKKILQFGIPSLTALYTVRSFVLPAIPDQFVIMGTALEKDTLMMIFFSLLMLASGFYMIQRKNDSSDCTDCPHNYFALMTAGLFEGMVTGTVGAGGGFIIIPVLMVFGKLSLKKAIANSLFIIGVKSFIGFLGSHDIKELNLMFLLKMMSLALPGMYFGIQMSKKYDAKVLKPVFGYFVFFMGTVILIKELLIS